MSGSSAHATRTVSALVGRDHRVRALQRQTHATVDPADLAVHVDQPEVEPGRCRDRDPVHAFLRFASPQAPSAVDLVFEELCRLGHRRGLRG